ncbi:MAG: DUF6348 family protein [Sediminibacterium sp.]|nr:DUF6348 family protein [Sediminibacterium sp.]
MKFILLSILIIALAGLAFYFYRSKQKDIVSKPQTKEMSNEDFLDSELLNQLRIKYPELNFKSDGGKISADNGLSVEAKIINHKTLPQSTSFQINFYTSHKHFQTSIEERLSGIGETDTGALQYGIQSFLSGQFPVIIHGIDLKHDPEMDFDVIDGNKKTHWHPLIGDIQLQGELSEKYDSTIYEKTYSFIKPLLTSKLKESNLDFHWFRYYISKMPNGEIIGDCYYDNEPYDEGLEVLKKLVATWDVSEFAGQKQFIMLRRCRD